jgi:hypothetical protein
VDARYQAPCSLAKKTSIKKGTPKTQGLNKKTSDEKRGTPKMESLNKKTSDKKNGTPKMQGTK